MSPIAARIAAALDGENMVSVTDWARNEGELSLGEALSIGRAVEPVVLAYMREALAQAATMLHGRFPKPDGAFAQPEDAAWVAGWVSAAEQITEDTEMLVQQALEGK